MLLSWWRNVCRCKAFTAATMRRTVNFPTPGQSLHSTYTYRVSTVEIHIFVPSLAEARLNNGRGDLQDDAFVEAAIVAMGGIQ